MERKLNIFFILCLIVFSTSCTKSYKVKPLPFKLPGAYSNATKVADTQIAARAFVDPKVSQEAFGFDVRGAGMLPVQVVFDNQGSKSLQINGGQTFLEDSEGNLWPILSRDLAHERETKYKKTEAVFKEGAYSGFLGAVAGAVIGAAIGIVTGDNVGSAAGKGAAVGAAAGLTLGGAKGYSSRDARRDVVNDLQRKSLHNKTISPKSIAYGFIFFPGEAKSANMLRLQLVEPNTDTVHVIKLNF